jgi:hypothetical protein
LLRSSWVLRSVIPRGSPRGRSVSDLYRSILAAADRLPRGFFFFRRVNGLDTPALTVGYSTASKVGSSSPAPASPWRRMSMPHEYIRSSSSKNDAI